MVAAHGDDLHSCVHTKSECYGNGSSATMFVVRPLHLPMDIGNSSDRNRAPSSRGRVADGLKPTAWKT